MLADIKAHILLIFRDPHPQGTINSKCYTIRHRESKDKRRNCT